MYASLVAQMVKNPPVKRETWIGSLGWEDPLEEGVATHSSILAWGIPWTEEPGGLQSMGSQRVGHTWVTKHTQQPPKSSGLRYLVTLEQCRNFLISSFFLRDFTDKWMWLSISLNSILTVFLRAIANTDRSFLFIFSYLLILFTHKVLYMKSSNHIYEDIKNFSTLELPLLKTLIHDYQWGHSQVRWWVKKSCFAFQL